LPQLSNSYYRPKKKKKKKKKKLIWHKNGTSYKNGTTYKSPKLSYQQQHKLRQKRKKMEFLHWLFKLLNALMNILIVVGIILLPMAIISQINTNVISSITTTTGGDIINTITTINTITNTLTHTITNTIMETVDLTAIQTALDAFSASITNSLTALQTITNNLQVDANNLQAVSFAFEFLVTGLPGVLNGNANVAAFQQLIILIDTFLNTRSLFQFDNFEYTGLVGIGGDERGAVQIIEIDLDEEDLIDEETTIVVPSKEVPRSPKSLPLPPNMPSEVHNLNFGKVRPETVPLDYVPEGPQGPPKPSPKKTKSLNWYLVGSSKQTINKHYKQHFKRKTDLCLKSAKKQNVRGSVCCIFKQHHRRSVNKTKGDGNN
jgi:hypothetical protein